MNKTCAKCKKEKDIKYFPANKGYKKRNYSYCKKCMKEMTRKKRESNGKKGYIPHFGKEYQKYLEEI